MFRVVLLLVLLLPIACVPLPPLTPADAAVHLKCPAEAVTITIEGERRHGVGCGRVVVFEIRGNRDEGYRWVVDREHLTGQR